MAHKYQGPDIPGMHWFSNSGLVDLKTYQVLTAEDTRQKFAAYLPQVPPEAIIVIRHQFTEGLKHETYCVYVETQYAAIADTWVAGMRSHLKTLFKAYGKELRDDD